MLQQIPTVKPKGPATAKKFASDYRELQQKVTHLSGDTLPPCFFCSADQLWHCSQSGYECKVFKAYAATLE